MEEDEDGEDGEVCFARDEEEQAKFEVWRLKKGTGVVRRVANRIRLRMSHWI